MSRFGQASNQLRSSVPPWVVGPFNVVCYGNSLTGGWANPDNYPTALATLRPADTVTNLGTANQFTAQMLTNWTTDVLPLASGTKKNVCIWWESVDQLDDHATTPAAELANLQSAATLCHSHSWLIVVGTVAPCTDDTGTQTDRDALCALVRANASSWNAIFSPDLDSRLNPNDPTYYQLAGQTPNVHLTALGYTGVIAPMVNAALSAMTP